MTLDPQPIRNWTLIQSLEHGILLDEAGTPSFSWMGPLIWYRPTYTVTPFWVDKKRTEPITFYMKNNRKRFYLHMWDWIFPFATPLLVYPAKGPFFGTDGNSILGCSTYSFLLF